MNKPKLIIFSAPSGTGKTTVVNYLLNTLPEQLGFSISATTRSKRPNEEHGKHYYFFSEAEFREKLANSEFLEHEEVYKGLFYGTLFSEVDRLSAAGKAVIFDVDVVGGTNIKKQYGDQALAVFLKPPSVEVLMDRLRKRDTEVEHHLQERIEKAKTELSYANEFDLVIVNDDLDLTFAKALQTVKDFLNN